MISAASSAALRHVATVGTILAMTIFVNAQQTTPNQGGQQQQTNPTQSGQQPNTPPQTEQPSNPAQNKQQTDTTQPQQPTEAQPQPTQSTPQPATPSEQQATPAPTTTPSDPASTTSGTPSTETGSTMVGGMGGDDIVATAMKAGKFNTLAKALEAAGLVETLKSGTYTVFAPTDEAFAKLPAGTLDDLLKPENRDRLRSILTYHLIVGKLSAADLAKINNVSTAQGPDMILMIKAKSNAVVVNNATVTQADVAASNGVVHAIDTVLMPKTMKGMNKSKNKATKSDQKATDGQSTTEVGTPKSGSSPSTSSPSTASPDSSTPSSSRPNSPSPNNSPSSTTQTP